MVRAPFLSVFLFFLAGAAAQNSIFTVAGGSPPATPTAATGASIGDPARVGADASGNVYFGALHSVFRVDAGGTLTRVAGNGRAGNSGDGGAAIAAQLTTPSGIVVDATGNIYLADRAAAVVRKIGTDGNISTVAGTGIAGYNGDGQPAAQAQLAGPMGLALDSGGNLYIADSQNHRIRKVGLDGTIATVAGNGGAGYGGDGGPATGTELNEPEGVAVDAAGEVYIADTVNDRVRKVAADGSIATVAGTGFSAVFGSIYDETGVSTTSGDNGPATSAAVVLPTDVAVDGAGNVYVSDYGNGRIRMVAKSTMYTVAGNSSGIPAVSGQAAISTRLNGPTGLAVDGAGNIYFAEGSVGTGSGFGASDYRVWKITTTGLLRAVAGNGLESYSGDGGAAAAAQFNGPAGIAVDQNGTIYIADSRNHRVRRVTAAGTIDTVAGNGTAGFSGDGGPATKAQLNGPMALAVDAFGDLFIADTRNNRIRKVTGDGTIYTIGGNGNASFYGDGGNSSQASVHGPQGIAVGPDGTVYVADTLNHRLRKITQDGVIQTVAGNGLAAFAGDGGAATLGSLNLPSGLALDSAGNLYIADFGNGRVREVLAQGGLATVAGNGSAGTGGDGMAATAAPLAGPQGVAVDSAGNIYIAEALRNRLRKVATDGTISTIAGAGVQGYSGDNGPATAAALNAPWGMAVDSAGTVYFTDSGNDAVRVVR